MVFKNLLFDFGGVILELAPEKSIEAFKQLGCPSDVFKGEFWLAGIFRKIDRGTATEAEFYDELRRIGRIPHATDAEILKAWNMFIPGVKTRTFEALKHLKTKYPLYMLSNVNLMHWRKCEEELMLYQGENVFNWFTKTFTSFQMHLQKPERAIYEAVANEAHINPEETLFIDDRQENLDGAALVGFQTMKTKDCDWIDKLNVFNQ